MYRDILPRVLNAYKISHSKIFPFQKGYRNEIWPVLTTNSRMINVTFYKCEPGIQGRIKRADAISGFLAETGLPTRQRLDNRIMLLKSSRCEVNVGVYNYLPGETIPWESYNQKRIKNLGQAMSNMHDLLKSAPPISLPSVYDEYIGIIKKMREYFSKHEVLNAIESKLSLQFDVSQLAKYKKLLQKYKNLPNQQPIHMDLVRGNILFDGEEISGILDFEKVAKGHTVVDVARTLAFLLVDCKYKPVDKVEKYFLHSGYKKRGRSKEVGNRAVMKLLVEMFLVYDLYKFLRHNPYEYLKLNEHYTRTRDILINYGVVSFI